jgi:hypothetical protein
MYGNFEILGGDEIRRQYPKFATLKKKTNFRCLGSVQGQNGFGHAMQPLAIQTENPPPPIPPRDPESLFSVKAVTKYFFFR